MASPIRQGARDRIFQCIAYLIVLLIALVTLLPFWELVVQSFSDRADAMRIGFKFYTTRPVLTAYQQVLSSPGIWQGFYNSVVRVVLGTVLSVTLTALTAYPLSKPHFIWNQAFTWIILFTMVFSGGLIPGYLMITKQLHMTDTIWALVLPGAVGAYNLVVMRNFLRTIPASLEESARIDGAGEWTVWLRIVLPLSLPVLATVALWRAVDHWNAYFDCLLYIRDASKYVLQILLRRVLVEQQMSVMADGMVMDMAAKPTEVTTRAALIVVSTLPIIMVYPFLQKFFIQGITLGSVKE